MTTHLLTFGSCAVRLHTSHHLVVHAINFEGYNPGYGAHIPCPTNKHKYYFDLLRDIINNFAAVVETDVIGNYVFSL